MRWMFMPVLIAAALAGKAAGQVTYPWQKHSVLPILFCPTDWDVSGTEVQQEATALSAAMLEIQQFYAANLGGRTFVLNDLQVVQGNHAKEYYGIQWNGGNIYTDGVDIIGNLEHQVVEELFSRGYPTPPAQNLDGYSVIIFVKGAGGYAGGRELTNGDGGWGIVGDWAIDSIQDTLQEGEYWWSGARLQKGAVAHELGHSFGLPHPDAYNGDWDGTVMGHWWNFPTIGLDGWGKNHLLTQKSAFFPRIPSQYGITGRELCQLAIAWDYAGYAATYDTNAYLAYLYAYYAYNYANLAVNSGDADPTQNYFRAYFYAYYAWYYADISYRATGNGQIQVGANYAKYAYLYLYYAYAGY